MSIDLHLREVYWLHFLCIRWQWHSCMDTRVSCGIFSL